MMTFDRAFRWSLAVLAVVCLGLLCKWLSIVLVPFFVAWVGAYLMYPLVRFLEVRCRLRFRVPCIFLALLLVGGVLFGLGWLTIPPLVRESAHLKDVALDYVQHGAASTAIPPEVEHFFREQARQINLEQWLRSEDASEALKSIVPGVWQMVLSTVGLLVTALMSLMSLLYFFFLLTDYETFATGYLRFVPARRRDFVRTLMHDVATSMRGYLGGQALVALSNCVMFSVGFWLIDMPVPLALGCFIGLISFVPYVQLVGFLPCTVLALLHAAETGESFWMLMLLVVVVYAVVQVLQDVVFTPRIMSGIMGLPPAIVLLSLTVWGYALGIIGLIIALPMTTLIATYYKRYIVRE